ISNLTHSRCKAGAGIAFENETDEMRGQAKGDECAGVSAFQGLDFAAPDLAAPFEIFEPDILATPLVFNSPHSGRVYPKRFLASSRLDALTLRRSEDAFVDELFAR